MKEIKTQLGSADQIVREGAVASAHQTVHGTCHYCGKDIGFPIPPYLVDYKSLFEEMEERFKEAVSHNGVLARREYKVENILTGMKKFIEDLEKK